MTETATEPLRDGLRRIYAAKNIGDARRIVVEVLADEFIQYNYDKLIDGGSR